MSTELINSGWTEERASQRMPLNGEITYRDEQNERGRATWCSIGRGGACIKIGRYLRPGRKVVLEDQSMELDGQIVWCRPTSDHGAFVAGLRVFLSDPGESLRSWLPHRQLSA